MDYASLFKDIEVTKSYKDKKYDSVIEYCAEISRLADCFCRKWRS